MNGCAWYNEIDPFAAGWLRELIRAGHSADGEVDTRSIAEVDPADLVGFTQCHFFAGIGGWSYALRLAGWPDDRPVWTGSCPCQPFSNAGKRKGFDDARHLWPVWRNLISQRHPATVFGEQVASAADWLRLVRGDLEALGYAVGAIPIEAASAGADHRRDRFWFVADTTHNGKHRTGTPGQTWRSEFANSSSHVADAQSIGRRGRSNHPHEGWRQQSPPDLREGGWITCADGKARRLPEPGICLLAHGVSARVGKLRGFGNAIDPRPAAAFIRASAHAITGEVDDHL